MLMRASGTETAQSKKLLTVAGSEVLTGREKAAKCLKGPDGGVVTQRTANPMPLAENRRSYSAKVLTRCIGFYGRLFQNANRARDTHPKGRDVKQARFMGSPVASGDAPIHCGEIARLSKGEDR
jgi:hypothetical protein